MLNMFDTDDMLAKMATDKMLVINMILGYEEAVMGRSDKELLAVLTGGLRGLVSGGRVGSWITGVELLQLVLSHQPAGHPSCLLLHQGLLPPRSIFMTPLI